MYCFIFMYFFGVNFLFGTLSGAWNMKDRKLYQGATIQSWGLLAYGVQLHGNNIDNFKACLRRAA